MPCMINIKVRSPVASFQPDFVWFDSARLAISRRERACRTVYHVSVTLRTVWGGGIHCSRPSTVDLNGSDCFLLTSWFSSFFAFLLHPSRVSPVLCCSTGTGQIPLKILFWLVSWTVGCSTSYHSSLRRGGQIYSLYQTILHRSHHRYQDRETETYMRVSPRVSAETVQHTRRRDQG